MDVNQLAQKILADRKRRPGTGAFPCPRCDNRMVTYRITARAVHAACGRPGCLQLVYSLKPPKLTYCQLKLLNLMRRGANITAERRWWLSGAMNGQIIFNCDQHDEWGGWPKRNTLEILHKRHGLLNKLPERDGEIAYTLNRTRCQELNVWKLKPTGGIRP